MNDKLEKFKKTKFKTLIRSLDFNNTERSDGVTEMTEGKHKSRTKLRITIDEYKKLLVSNKWTQEDFVTEGYSKHQILFFNWILKGKCTLSKDEFIKEYTINLLELDDIAKKYNINREHITMLREFYGIPRQGHKRRLRFKEQVDFTPIQRQLVYGCLLGDGKIEPSGNVFSMRHSVKQIEYCKYKLSVLSNHTNYKEPTISMDYDERYDSFNETCFFGLLSHKEIESLYPLIYINGKKTVTEKWLDMLDDYSLAIWYMDDGHLDCKDYGNPCIQLHTESFSYEQNIIIQKWFRDKYNIYPSVKNRSDNYLLLFNVDNTEKLIQIVSPYIIDSMKYKIYKSDNLFIRKNNVISNDLEKTPTKSKFEKLNENEKYKIVDEIFNHYRHIGFPFYNFCLDEKRLMFSKIKNLYTSTLLLRDNVIKPNYRCCNLIQHYQPQMFNMASKGSITPLDIFNDDEMFRDAIYRRLKYGTCTPSGIRSILKTYKNNRGVSNFPPAIAKFIYDDLLEDNSSVLDFCAGFGGRLMGAISSNKVKKYIGIDILQSNCDGLKTINEELNNTGTCVDIINGASEDILFSIDEKFDMIFTSPPYFDNEIYSQDDGQSCYKYGSYDKWLYDWLMPLIRRSFVLLKENGYLVLSIGKTHNGKDISEDVKTILSYDIQLYKEYKMQTGVNEYQRKNMTKKYEPILVYKK